MCLFLFFPNCYLTVIVQWTKHKAKQSKSKRDKLSSAAITRQYSGWFTSLIERKQKSPLRSILSVWPFPLGTFLGQIPHCPSKSVRTCYRFSVTIMQITANNQPDITMSLLQKQKPQHSASQKSNASANHKLAMLQANQAAIAAMASQHTKRASQLARLQISNGKSLQVALPWFELACCEFTTYWILCVCLISC